MRGDFIKDTAKGISDLGGYANNLLLNMGKTFQEEQEAQRIRDRQF